MRTGLLSLGLASSLFVAFGFTLAAGDADPIAKDRKFLKGTWKVLSIRSDGKDLPDDVVAKMTVVNQVDGGWRLLNDGKESSSGKSDIDPTAKLKTIDFMPTSGGGSGNEFLGIYEFAKKTRKLCFAPKDKGRPTEFEAPAGSGRVLVVFERVK